MQPRLEPQRGLVMETCPDFTRRGWESWTQASPREYGNRLVPPPVVPQSHTAHHHVQVGMHPGIFIYAESDGTYSLLSDLPHAYNFVHTHSRSVWTPSLLFFTPSTILLRTWFVYPFHRFWILWHLVFLLTAPILLTTQGPQWVRNGVEDFQGLM